MSPTPTTIGELRALFAKWEFPRERVPRGAPATLLIALMRLYSDRGLLDVANPRPLCEICPNAETCWNTARDALREGEMCLPWIGPRYKAGGVAIVAVNPNLDPEDTSELLLEYWISYERHIATLRRGDKSDERSRFAYGAYRSAAALLDAFADRRVIHRRPEELADAVLSTARLQAVKCVPKRASSTPTPDMWRHCPGMLLADELDVLRPGAVLVLGGKAREQVEMLGGFVYDARCRSDDLWRGRMRRDGWDAQVYGVAHPGARQGVAQRSELALLRHLRRTRFPVT
jgi:hypothetical protein